MTNHSVPEYQPTVADLAKRALAICERNPVVRPASSLDTPAMREYLATMEIEQRYGVVGCLARHYGMEQHEDEIIDAVFDLIKEGG